MYHTRAFLWGLFSVFLYPFCVKKKKPQKNPKKPKTEHQKQTNKKPQSIQNRWVLVC